MIEKVEAVKYWWREWYTRITFTDGSTHHSEPWNSQWAAEHVAKMWREALAQKGRIPEWMTRRSRRPAQIGRTWRTAKRS